MAVTSETAILSDLIAGIYDAALDPTLWRRALERSCAFVGGSSAVLYWHDAATRDSAVLHMFNDDPRWTQLYFEKYLPMNPVFPAATFIESGLIYTPTDLIPEAELVETRFHREWVQPQGIVDVVCVNLEKGTTSSSVLNIRRDETQGIVDDAARRRAALLVPHFQRAVSIGRLFDQDRSAKAVLTETFDRLREPVVLLERNGRIVFVNEAGRAMLDEATLLREWRQELVAVAPEAQRALRELLTAAENGDLTEDSAAIPLSASRHSLSFAHVLPLTSGDRRRANTVGSAIAAVFVRKTSPASPRPLEALASLYGLTASEVRVLDALTKVSGVRALAELLGLAEATVKTHLHHLFGKTSTTRQSELVKLIAGFEPPDAE